MNDLYDRIDLKFDLDIISKEICNHFNFGQYISNEIITVGYEDFNYILTTSSGKYCVKIFNKERTLEDCKNYIDRISLSSEIEVNSPRVYKCGDEILFIITIDGVQFRLCVFEFIDGASFFDSNLIPSDDEIKEIIRQMAIIHKAKLESNFIYDTWTLTNFEKEYEKKKQYLSDKDADILIKLQKKFKEIDFDKLVYSFVHGDIISSNVIKDKNNKLWIIDYAVSNYLPRIVDLVVSSCNLCLDPDSKDNSLKKIRMIITEYEKYNKLSKYEKEMLPLFFELANGMGILQTSYQKNIGNTSEENEYWYNLSIKGMDYSCDDFWSKVLGT